MLSSLIKRGRGISVSIVTGRPGFDSRQGQEFFLFATTSRPILGSTQPAIQWVPAAQSAGA